MITVIDSAEYPVGKSEQSRSAAHVFVGHGYQVRAAIRAIGVQIERRFAAFAGVPYQDPLSREQWEQLWESEL